MSIKNQQINLCDVSIAQTELSEIERTKYQKADWNLALNYAKKNLVQDKTSGEPKPYPLTCDLESLKKYGIGIFFYFDMLQKVAIFFFIATIICLPTFYSNYTGEGISNPSGLFVLSKLSLANQPQLKVTIPNSSATTAEKDNIKEENDQNIRDFVEEMAIRKYYVWIPDMVYSSLFFLFILYYKRFTKSQIDSQKKTITPSQYSIEIKGLPRNTLDTSELKVFITNVMKKYISNTDPLVVIEVAFCKDFKDTLFLHRKESILIEQISIEKKKLEIQNIQTSSQLKKKEKNLNKVQEQIDKIVTKKLGGNNEYKFYETLSAFVVFNTFQQKKQFVELFFRYTHPHWIYQYILCCLKPRMPQDLKFRGMYTLQINPKNDEPSNIKWENLDIKTGNRFYRGIAVFFMILAVMFITLATLLAANVVQPQSSQSCPSNSYTLEQAKKQDTSSAQYCYCTSISIKEILANSSIKNYCWETYLSYLQTQALIIGTTFAIVIVNLILVVVIKKFSNFLRFPNVTSEITTSAVILFICTFINTAILTLLLQSDIFGFITAIYFTSPIPPLKDLQDQKSQTFSSDFSRDWYQRVGQKILLTMMFSTLFPHVLDWFIIPLKKYFRERNAKKKLIQLEMNKLVIGPDFNLTAHYTSFMNVVFVCLFYSSGQPLLIPCAAIALTTQYWVFKYKLLRWHRKPPAFDDLLNRSMLKVIPWSLMFHLAIGIYMYGQPLIFPKDSNQISITISDTPNSAGVYEVAVSTNQDSPILDRTYSSYILFLLLALALGLYIAEVAVIKILRSILSKILPCIFRISPSVKVTALETNDPQQFTYLNQYKKMGQLASYDIKMNENYYPLIQAIDVGSQNLSNTPRSIASPATPKGQGFGETVGKLEIKKSRFQQQPNEISTENFNLAYAQANFEDQSPLPFGSLE